LGVQAYTLPKIGFLALFVESPQGLIAVIGMISLYYIGKTDAAMRDEKLKGKFCAKLSELTLHGDLTIDLYNKLIAATKYSDSICPESIEDSRVLEYLYWIKGGALDDNWNISKVKCPICGKKANRFESSKNSTFTICSSCDEINKSPKFKMTSKITFNDASNRSHISGIGYSPSINRKRNNT
jgi:hypothetical protein